MDTYKHEVKYYECDRMGITHHSNYVRIMEEAGPLSYLSVIFNAASFSDLLGRLDFVKQIMREDERQYKKLTAAKEAERFQAWACCL